MSAKKKKQVISNMAEKTQVLHIHTQIKDTLRKGQSHTKYSTVQ